MIIKIYEHEDSHITISNDQLNNDNFVDLIVGEYGITLSIDELQSALNAFELLRVRNRENLLDLS